MPRGTKFTALLCLYFYTPTVEALRAYGSCKRKTADQNARSGLWVMLGLWIVYLRWQKWAVTEGRYFIIYLEDKRMRGNQHILQKLGKNTKPLVFFTT